MNKLLLFIFAIGQLTICKAQQFAFQMKFVDAIGNIDSLILGYDQIATDTLDVAFGETNIISSPYTNGLNVRAGNVWFQQNFNIGFGQTSFETKKQILPNICGTGNIELSKSIAEINIVSSHFPIKVYWNKILFNDSCKNGSVFTSVHPGGWWDTGGFIEPLNIEDSTTIFKNQYYYRNGTDTVNVYWVAFSDSTILSAAINKLTSNKNSINIYPNPASDFLSISMSEAFGKINRIEFYNLFGQFVLSSKEFSNINIVHLLSGIYFIKVTTTTGIAYTSKFIKL
jgi:hypothetical protein